MFTKYAAYPKWNPDKKENVPDIPNWGKTTIGNFSISFEKGTKICFIKKVYSGDYTVHITSTDIAWNNLKYTDTILFKTLLVPNISKLTDKKSFIKALRHIISLNIESEVLSFVNNTTFNDSLKVCLYTLWHRAIIEDRLYHQSKYAGHKQVIGIAIALVKKINGDNFIHDNKITLNPFSVNVDLKCLECNDWYNL